MEEYLTVTELSARIKFSRQTLYNLIYKGTFIIGKHYLKLRLSKKSFLNGPKSINGWKSLPVHVK